MGDSPSYYYLAESAHAAQIFPRRPRSRPRPRLGVWARLRGRGRFGCGCAAPCSSLVEISFAQPMSVRVKICGITNGDDALAAVDAGADALGFMFYEPSPRNVPSAVATEIIRQLPPFVARVGVFVDATADTVRKAVAECGLDTLQFHGDETPEFCRAFAPLKVYKAFRVQNLESLDSLPRYRTDAWLLDSFAPEKP